MFEEMISYNKENGEDLKLKRELSPFFYRRGRNFRMISIASITYDIIRIIDYLYRKDGPNVSKKIRDDGIRNLTENPQRGFNLLKILNLVKAKGYDFHVALSSVNENTYSDVYKDTYYVAKLYNDIKIKDYKTDFLGEMSILASLSLYGVKPKSTSNQTVGIANFFRRYGNAKFTIKSLKSLISPFETEKENPELVNNIDSALYAIIVSSYSTQANLKARAYITKNGYPILFEDENCNWIFNCRDFIKNIINKTKDSKSMDWGGMKTNANKTVYNLITMDTKNLSIVDRLIIGGVKNYIKFITDGIKNKSIDVSPSYLKSVVNSNYKDFLFNEIPFEEEFEKGDRMVGIYLKSMVPKLYLLKEKYNIKYNTSGTNLFRLHMKSIKNIDNAIMKKEKLNMMGCDIAFNAFIVENLSRVTPSYSRSTLKSSSIISVPVYNFHRDIFSNIYKYKPDTQETKFRFIDILAIFASSGFLVDFGFKSKTKLADRIKYALNFGFFNLKSAAIYIDFNGSEKDIDKVETESLIKDINKCLSKVYMNSSEANIEDDVSEVNNTKETHITELDSDKDLDGKYAIILPMTNEIMNALDKVLPNYDIIVLKRKNKNQIKEELKTDFSALCNLYTSNENGKFKDDALAKFCEKWFNKK